MLKKLLILLFVPVIPLGILVAFTSRMFMVGFASEEYFWDL